MTPEPPNKPGAPAKQRFHVRASANEVICEGENRSRLLQRMNQWLLGRTRRFEYDSELIAWVGPRPILDESFWGVFSIPIAWGPLLVQFLREQGHEVSIDTSPRRDIPDERVNPMSVYVLRSPNRAWELSPRYGWLGTALLRNLSDRLCAGVGGIEYASAFDRLEKLRVLLDVFHRAGTVVLARSRREVKELYDGLQTYLGDRVGICDKAPYYRLPKQVMVMTPSHLHHIDHACLQMAVIADAAGWPDGALWRLWRAVQDFTRFEAVTQVYGFIPADRSLSREDRLRAELACGPVLMPHRPAPRLLLLPCPAGPRPKGPAGSLEAKRGGIWLNRPRNEAIARFAKAMQAADSAALSQWLERAHSARGVTPESLLGQAPPRSAPQAPRLLVESLEHGRALQNLLPGWTLVGRDVKAVGPEQPAILTHQHALRYGLRAHRLIRADGGEGDLHALGFPPALHEEPPHPPHPCLVVDFLGGHKGRWSKSDRVRIQGYRDRQWGLVQSPALDPGVQRPTRSVKGRPTGRSARHSVKQAPACPTA